MVPLRLGMILVIESATPRPGSLGNTLYANEDTNRGADDVIKPDIAVTEAFEPLESLRLRKHAMIHNENGQFVILD